MSLSEYIPGSSVIHRIRPGAKIVFLVILGTVLFIIQNLELSLVVLLFVLLFYQLARISLAIAWAQLRPAIWIIIILFVVQFILEDWITGLLVVVRLSALLLFASLVTLTTKSSDMIDALERGLKWLKFIGINPAKVSLALSLSLRFIPVLASITSEVREAQKARGLDKSIIAVVVPVIVRTLKMADDISAAIEARSYDPDYKKTDDKTL